MAAARFERVRIDLAAEDGAIVLAAESAALRFDGHLRLAPDGDEEPNRGGVVAPAMPKLQTGDRVTVSGVRTEGHVTEPSPRHTEAGLVRRLEERGIGRPRPGPPSWR